MRKSGATLPQICLTLMNVKKDPSLEASPEISTFIKQLNAIQADPKDFYKSFNERLAFLLTTLKGLLV
jgi:hypothetical protein